MYSVFFYSVFSSWPRWQAVIQCSDSPAQMKWPTPSSSWRLMMPPTSQGSISQWTGVNYTRWCQLKPLDPHRVVCAPPGERNKTDYRDHSHGTVSRLVILYNMKFGTFCCRRQVLQSHWTIRNGIRNMFADTLDWPWMSLINMLVAMFTCRQLCGQLCGQLCQLSAHGGCRHGSMVRFIAYINNSNRVHLVSTFNRDLAD